MNRPDGWAWLRRVIAHWDEFGPAYGFSEIVDRARDALLRHDRELVLAPEPDERGRKPAPEPE